MANVPGSHRPTGGQRPAGTRFKTDGSAAQGARPAGTRFAGQQSTGGQRFAQPQPQQPVQPASPAQGDFYPVTPAYQSPSRTRQKSSPIPVIIGLLIAVAVVAGAAFVVFPMLFGGGTGEQVEAGQVVEVTIPGGASGDAIAAALTENHVIQDAGEYYAAVKKLNAEMSLKPGTYQFETLQDPVEVVKALVAGPAAVGTKLTIPEGKTIKQTAAIVEEVLGIPASDFEAQAKASNYKDEYAFLSEAANDSLEGFLFPKTYMLPDGSTADDVIRVMLDQYQVDVVDAIDFEAARAGIKSRFGVELSNYEVLNLASVVEREGLNAEQRAHVAAVFLNRFAGKGEFAGRPYLESDATLMYETGGAVTADDIQNIDSPYNSYKNGGLPPTPICSPSLESIQATLNPLDSDDLYFFITQDEEYFSQTYDEHMQSW